MQFGVIGSAGGSSFFSALDCLENSGGELNPHVVVNRPCGLSDRCGERSISCTTMAYESRLSFSARCAGYFRDLGVLQVLLYYDRLLQASEFARVGIEVHNIHPSLLPSFPGMDSVEKAYHHGVKVLGSTLHRIDEGIDTGPIEAQVCTHLNASESLARLQTISYLQKTYLNLVWLDLLRGETAPSGVECSMQLLDCSSHSLADKDILHRFNALCSSALRQD